MNNPLFSYESLKSWGRFNVNSFVSIIYKIFIKEEIFINILSIIYQVQKIIPEVTPKSKKLRILVLK